MPPKKASPYEACRKILEKDQVFQAYDAVIKDQKQVWLLKMFDKQKIEDHDLLEEIEHNIDLFQALNDRPFLVYVREIFEKGGKMFIAQQKYDIRLSSYLHQKKCLSCLQVEKISRDIFQGICDLYEEQCNHCNIRPQHFVHIPSEDRWKLDIVISTQDHRGPSIYHWNPKFASPENIKDPESLDDVAIDAQIVWQFGFIVAYLLIGESILDKPIHKDDEIPWLVLKDKTIGSDLAQLLNRCLKVQYAKRADVKEFFSFRIFEKCRRPEALHGFLTKSKILGGTTDFLRQSRNTAISKRFDQPPTKIQVIKLSEKELLVQFQKGKMALDECKYFRLISEFQELIDDAEDRTIIGFIFLKIANHLATQLNAKLIQNRKTIQKMNHQGFIGLMTEVSNVKKEISSNYQQRLSLLKYIDPKQHLLSHRKARLAQFEADLSRETLRCYFNFIAGHAYNQLKIKADKQRSDKTERAVCYVALSALVTQKINLVNGLSKYILETENKSLVTATQELVKEFFEFEIIK